MAHSTPEELLRRQLSLERTKRKVWGPLTRDLITCFKKFCDEDQHLPSKKIRTACNALQLFPSLSQVHEMTICAFEYGSPCKTDHITFGEFCVLVAELQNYYLINPKTPVPYSLVKTRPEIHVHRRKRRESLAHFSVFLGGSCNPTHWRSEMAIPFFKQHGITFYNPVQNWKPELMELEAQAKQMAEILFFVIDSKTRAISSMIEVAYLVATQRQVVVTMCKYKPGNIEIDGCQLTDSEMLDLRKGRLILTDLVERNSVPIFSDIPKALTCTHIMVERDEHVTKMTLEDGAQPVKFGHLKIGRALLELREAFNSVDDSECGILSSQDVCFAYKSCTGEEMDSKWLKHNRKSQNEFDFEEFCAIVTEYKHQTQTPSVWARVLDHILMPFKWLVSKFNSQPDGLSEYPDEDVRDVYLGGSAGLSQWRSNITIPLLRKHGLSFVDPSIHNWDQKLIPIHVALREKCRLLFYIITDDSRSVGSMCEAGYYIGMGCRMVLCVHKLKDGAVIGGEKLTACAIKDYNRGRDYLCDLASREGIPMFEDIEEATNCVVSILTSDNQSIQSL